MGTAARLRVADVMSAPLETISADATVAEAANAMKRSNISALFVPGSSGGIVTNTDVRNVVAEGLDPAETVVGDVMTAPVESITTDVQLQEAAAMMTNYGIKHLPVVDADGDYVGMVSTTDVTTALT